LLILEPRPKHHIDLSLVVCNYKELKTKLLVMISLNFTKDDKNWILAH